jgi:hypothetical protein
MQDNVEILAQVCLQFNKTSSCEYFGEQYEPVGY